MIARINISNAQGLQEGVVSCQKLTNNPNFIVPNSIVKIENNHALITIINTSDEMKSLKIPNLNVQALSKQTTMYKLAPEKIENSTENRVKILTENLRLNHLNREEKESIEKICAEFNDIFHLLSDLLTKTTATTHSIRTTSNDPIHTKLYRFPEIHKDEVYNQTNKMLEQGIIQHSMSP